ncbi:MAG TPA: hypothetical protein VHR66_15390 [Gemmataceae bacterium]|jgi:predicted RNA polymerase sigma factor|nr:hypothetical protein [Gemmataceae bacterium]
MKKFLFIFRHSTDPKSRPSPEEMQALGGQWYAWMLDRLAAVPADRVPARYPGWHAVIGELQFRLGQYVAAAEAWQEALRWTTSRADHEFLSRRMDACHCAQ